MDGLWIANFTAGSAHGSGILVLRAGDLIGGDTGHTYKGNWQEDGPNLNARICVEPWIPEEGQQAGTREQPFMITLTGSRTDKSATLHGHPDERPDLLVSVEMKRTG